ncbi:uncharacterized protein [Rutidosis leptorrhynchoides]|uniref:uncharacterized protein n=1 Tax=Rutidosis leptorrhynchoides TaxID=125765 RepID=UPI003A993D00
MTLWFYLIGMGSRFIISSKFLIIFYGCSGLKINVPKSSLFGIVVVDSIVDGFVRNLDCSEGSFPFQYLGLPMGCNMSRISKWKSLEDRLTEELSMWKGNLLSVDGRLTLIKSVLDNGGLDIVSLHALNYALIFKWIWRFISCDNAMWISVIKAIHGEQAGLDDIPTLTSDANADCTLADIFRDGSCPDSWSWLNDDGNSYSVSDTRVFIDNILLSSAARHTRWKGIISRKLNFFLWRLALHRLPTPINLSRRCIDIQVIGCALCNHCVESVHHVFFECNVASELWIQVRTRADVAMPSF